MNDECTCDEDRLDGHTCPFKEDVHGDSETTCNCCASCEAECGQSI